VNLQWIKDGQGVNHLIEVNPRISGGLQITLAACPDFITAVLRQALGLGSERMDFEPGVLTMKYDAVISRRLGQ
jgi:hypothetical protein